MRSHSLRLCASVAVLSLIPCLFGCAHRRVPSVQPETTERGSATMRFVTKPRTDIPENQELQPPRPKHDLLPPEYPPEALAAHAEHTTVFLRFVISETGDVTEIADIPGTARPTGPFADSFRSAAEKAVRGWKFAPAEWQWLQDGKDLNGDGKPDFRRLLKFEPISVYLDVRFDFKIVGGKGEVRTGEPVPQAQWNAPSTESAGQNPSESRVSRARPPFVQISLHFEPKIAQTLPGG